MQSPLMQTRCSRPAASRHVAAAPLLAPQIARSRTVAVKASLKVPTVAETKRKFVEAYPKPIAAVYSTVLQELLVQQHFIRYSSLYQYNKIYAMGFVNVFEQVMESVPADERATIFTAYITSLGESPEKYRKDAASIESQASALSGPDQLVPGSSSDLQQELEAVAQQAAAGKFSYNKFFAIGLFRLLELTGAKEPSALERLVKSVNVAPEKVNKDLMLYKGVLSKLSAAKELMKELMDREKKKAVERLAEKQAAAEKEAQAASA